jgi:hypothetical protein
LRVVRGAREAHTGFEPVLPENVDSKPNSGSRPEGERSRQRRSGDDHQPIERDRGHRARSVTSRRRTSYDHQTAAEKTVAAFRAGYWE